MAKKAALALVAVVAILLGLSAFLYRQNAKVRAQLTELDWRLALDKAEQSTDAIRPEVGVIQFLRRGYSVTLDSLSYDQNGVRLVGRIGNPHLQTISSLTIYFAARPHLWTVRAKYIQDQNPFGLYPEPTGRAEVSVRDLLPGGETPFRIVIPNVKQSNEGYDIEVRFSGERYSYLR